MAASEASSAGSATSTEDTADVVVKIGNNPLDGETAARVSDLKLQKSIGAAAELTLQLDALDQDTGNLLWVDDKLFAPGATVDVELGYVDHRDVKFHGDIVGLDLEIGPGSAVLTITARDILHRLGRGQRSHPHSPNKSYAAVVRDIAQERNVPVDAADDATHDPVHGSVNQQNQSDLTFLLDLAAKIGYELFANGPTLVFRKSHLDDKQGQLILTADRDLVRLHATLNAAGQLGGVDIRILDTETKSVLSASEDNPDAADGSYGPARTVIVGEALTSQEQVNARAKSELTAMRSSFLEVDGSCLGRTDLAPGMVIELDKKLGKRFGGLYHVRSVTHTVSSGGFRTSFTLKGQPR